MRPENPGCGCLNVLACATEVIFPVSPIVEVAADTMVTNMNHQIPSSSGEIPFNGIDILASVGIEIGRIWFT